MIITLFCSLTGARHHNSGGVCGCVCVRVCVCARARACVRAERKNENSSFTNGYEQWCFTYSSVYPVCYKTLDSRVNWAKNCRTTVRLPYNQFTSFIELCACNVPSITPKTKVQQIHRAFSLLYGAANFSFQHLSSFSLFPFRSPSPAFF